jgi:sec-independent protein translocase protein TatB
MHLGDSIFIFILALVLFGPKKLPEMARQIGKLMAEFRRASNDFRMQIDEELRTVERQEQQKKQEAERAALVAPAPGPETILPPAAAETSAGSLPAGSLQVLPPAIGEQVSAGSPYAVSATPDPVPETAEVHPLDHPLLRVDSIPVDPNDPHADGSQPTGIAVAEANATRLAPTAPPTSFTLSVTPSTTLSTTPEMEAAPEHSPEHSDAQASVPNG